MYKSTFYSLKISPKNHPPLNYMGQKLRSKKVQDKLASLKENSKIKDKFFNEILTQK